MSGFTVTYATFYLKFRKNQGSVTFHPLPFTLPLCFSDSCLGVGFPRSCMDKQLG